MRKLHRVRGEEIEPQTNNVLKGQLTIPDSLIEKIDKQLEKIESKTSKMLDKHFKKEELRSQAIIEDFPQTIGEPSLKRSQTIAKASVNRSPKPCKVSYVDYLMMKGIRKEILKYVKDNMFEDQNETYSFIDTDEIILKIKTSANVIRDTVYKLKKEGWFMIENQQYSRRLVKINPNNYQK